MEFVNPNALKTIEAYVEPSLKGVKTGERFQFQRLGYFNVDNDSSSEKLVFNKTVGLRDSWAKQKPKPQHELKQNIQQQKQQRPQRKPIDVIQQLGKKYTNLPESKQQKVRVEILELAKNVSYEELEPLFNTAVKKVGTRIAVTLVLGVLLENGLIKNENIQVFLNKAKEDKNAVLVAEAQMI
jgi:glutaminyl-tRNA synthetase